MPETPEHEPSVSEGAPEPPVVVKKYANRRLYNTESSSYITLDTLAEMVRGGRDFVVYDAKTGEDITRSVLTQIIVEEENKGRALLPTSFLRHLIAFYGDSLQNLVPRYLEQAMASFARQQQDMRVAMQQTMGNLFPFNMEEMGRQMERAMTLFSPFYRPPGAGTQDAPREGDSADQEVRILRAEVAELRRQLADARAERAGSVGKAESKADRGV
ncbi:MAG: polyhydroxyalkanoate synthesis repressor PhaR [Rhodospirillales bacterium]|nr:polyhydroxyalkanoate synthesis repressor PhaR [Rhodospirillales bacterium]